MPFLHIDDDDNAQAISELSSYLTDDGSKIFMLVYMDGCPPCIATHPEWKKLENVLQKKIDDDTVIVDINQKFLNEINSLTKLIEEKKINEINSFPTIMYISKKGEVTENFHDSPVIEKTNESQNTVDNLHKWITHVLEEAPSQGGKARFPRVRLRRSTRKKGLRTKRKTQRKRKRKRKGKQ